MHVYLINMSISQNYAMIYHNYEFISCDSEYICYDAEFFSGLQEKKKPEL